MTMQRKGAVLPLIAILMLAMILVLGLMVELSWLYSSRFEAQSASDLAARSALAALYDNVETLDQVAIDDAKALGVQVYSLNFPTVPITADQLSFGATAADQTFSEIDQSNQFRDITASRVEHQQRYKSILGTLMAKEEINLPIRSVAETARFELVLCLDASRSMNRAIDDSTKFPLGGRSIHEPPLPGSRWFTLTDIVEDFVDRFTNTADGAQLGLVTFGGGFHVVRPPVSPLDATASRVNLELDSFSVNAPLAVSTMESFATLPALGLGTSIVDGLNDSLTLLEQSPVPGRQFVVLFTDGNQVIRNRPSEVTAGRRAQQLGIPVYTIGLSTNTQKLEQISRDSGGLSFAVDTQEELEAAFAAIAAQLGERITQ